MCLTHMNAWNIMIQVCCFCLGFMASRNCFRISLSVDMLIVLTKSRAGSTPSSVPVGVISTLYPLSSSALSVCERVELE